MSTSYSRNSPFIRALDSHQGEPTAITKYGDLLDSKRQVVVDTLHQATTKQSQLEKDGCLKGHIHFKADGKTMFMYLPVNEAGHRKYVHIGVRAEKQLEARQQVAREDKRSRLAMRAGELAVAADELEGKLCFLLNDYDRLQRLQKDIQELIATPDAGEYQK